jgi:hypothetical protein
MQMGPKLSNSTGLTWENFRSFWATSSSAFAGLFRTSFLAAGRRLIGTPLLGGILVSLSSNADRVDD